MKIPVLKVGLQRSLASEPKISREESPTDYAIFDDIIDHIGSAQTETSQGVVPQQLHQRDNIMMNA